MRHNHEPSSSEVGTIVTYMNCRDIDTWTIDITYIHLNRQKSIDSGSNYDFLILNI